MPERSRIAGEPMAPAARVMRRVEPGTLAHGAGDNWWATTVKGNALANASFGKPISRATATRLLGQVIERARAYNADPARLLAVTEIVVFGSYLDPAVDPLGDLDLAVSTARRDTDGQRYVDKVLEYARASGRSFSAFHDRLFWPPAAWAPRTTRSSPTCTTHRSAVFPEHGMMPEP